MSIIDDLDDYKLETSFQRDPECILHTSHKSDRGRGIQKVLIVDRWVPQKPVLGSGTFGTVRLEKCLNGYGTKGTYRAVKQLHKMHLSRSKIDFKKELMALTKFSRSKFSRYQVFVEFLGWFEDDDNIYLAMEYFPLGTLDRFVSDEIKERDAKLISSQLLEGLTIMHKEGFAHRDLKPQNIFVVQKQPDWWVKIGDFGISKRVSNNDTALHTATGTPHYLAPEVSHFVDTGNEESDAYTDAVDIWSFACVVYQIMALQVPFPNYPKNLLEFCRGGSFPEAPLVKRTSEKGIDFVKSILVPLPALRPRAQDLMQSDWLQFEDSLPESFPDASNQISDGVSDAPAVRDLAAGLSVVSLQETQTTKTGPWKEDTLAATIRKPHPKSLSQVIPQTAYDTFSPQHQLLRNQLSPISNNSNDLQHHPSYYEDLNDMDWGISSSNQDIKRKMAKDTSEERGLNDISLVASSSRNSNNQFRNRAAGKTHPRNDSRLSPYGDDQDKILDAPSTPSYYSDAEASASRSTHDQSSLYMPHRSTDMPAKKADFESSTSLSPQDQSLAFKQHGRESVFSPRSAIAESISEATTQVYVKAPATLQGHSDGVRAVAFSPDGKLIASASADQTIRLWDLATGVTRATLQGHSDGVCAVAFSPDGKLIASASADQTVRLWDLVTGVACATLQGHLGLVNAVTFSPDSKLIASASADRMVRLWDSATRAAYTTLQGHLDAVRAVAFSPDGKLIASASADRTIRLWDLATGVTRATLQGHLDGVCAVAFSPDGKLIASASADRTVRISATEAALGRLKGHLRWFYVQGHSRWVYAVAFSPDGKLIASASADRTIKLWDSATGAARATLQGHSDAVRAIAFSPDGKLIASASADQTVRLWDSAIGVDNTIRHLESAIVEDKTIMKYFKKVFK